MHRCLHSQRRKRWRKFKTRYSTRNLPLSLSSSCYLPPPENIENLDDALRLCARFGQCHEDSNHLMNLGGSSLAPKTLGDDADEGSRRSMTTHKTDPAASTRRLVNGNSGSENVGEDEDDCTNDKCQAIELKTTMLRNLSSDPGLEGGNVNFGPDKSNTDKTTKTMTRFPASFDEFPPLVEPGDSITTRLDDGSIVTIANPLFSNRVIVDSAYLLLGCNSSPNLTLASATVHPEEASIKSFMASNKAGSDDTQDLSSTGTPHFSSDGMPLQFAGTFPSRSEPTTQNLQSELTNRMKGTSFFPKRLMDLLLEEGKTGSVVQWRLNGMGFEVVSHERFATELIPKFFRRPTHFSSFVRKLYLWGFRKATTPEISTDGAFTGRHHEVFCHTLFRRDQPHLCMQMVLGLPRRKRLKQQSNKSHKNPNNGMMEEQQEWPLLLGKRRER